MKYPCLCALASLILTTAAPAQTELIGVNATWDYLHPTTGVDPATLDPTNDFATTWQRYVGYDGPDFTADIPGPFSYGGITYFTAANGGTGSFIGVGGTATAPTSGLRFTAYFKKQFTTTEDYSQATVRLLADDGVVIYLDGVEVKRVNLTGPNNGSGDTYSMLADGAASETALTADFSIGAIATGTHVIAVSLHNSDPTSSDLGLSFRLFGSSPPPVPGPPMMRTNFGGNFVEVIASAALAGTGWAQDSPPLSFAHVSGGVSTLNSVPIDLAAVGEVYFTAQLYVYESSATSNFESDDSFTARLEVTRDDNSTFDIFLVPSDLDTSLDNTLAGDEMNPDGKAVEELVFFGRQLRAVIPANAKSVRVLISSDNDSTSEEFDIGGMLISDVPPGSDVDGDGVSRESELWAGTDPSDPTSYLRINSLIRSYNAGTNEQDHVLSFPGVGNMWYAVETSTDGRIWSLRAFTRPTATNPDYLYTLGLTAAEDPGPGILIRLRAVP